MPSQRAAGSAGDAGEPLVSVTEAASILGVSHATVLEWIASDRLGHGQFADGRLGVRATTTANGDPGTRSGRLTTFALDGDPAQEQALPDVLRSAQSDRVRGELPRDDIDLLALAGAMADRIAPVAPQRLPVRSRGTWLILGDPADGEEAVDLVRLAANAGGDPPDRLAAVVRQVLAVVQDFMLQETTEPWPPSGAGGIAPAFALADGEVVRGGYGTPAALVWGLEPLATEDFLRDA